MINLNISEIQILPIKPQRGLISFASCVINNQFYIGNIAIYSAPISELGYRLVYPNKILANGKSVPSFYPISRKVGNQVTNVIVNEYLKIVESLMKGNSENEQNQTSTSEFC